MVPRWYLGCLVVLSTVYQDCISQELPNLQKLGAICCRLPHTTDSFSLLIV